MAEVVEEDAADVSEAAAASAPAPAPAAKVKRLPYNLRKPLHRQCDLQRRARMKKRLLKLPMEPLEVEACLPEKQRRQAQQQKEQQQKKRQQQQQKKRRQLQQKALQQQHHQLRKPVLRQKQQQQQTQQTQQQQTQRHEQYSTWAQPARARAWIKRVARRQRHQVTWLLGRGVGPLGERGMLA
jgi:hypothetical protein